MDSYHDHPADCDEPYVYEPLPSKEYFRYLSLEPGYGEEPLRCSLRTYEIGKAQYEALSYVWGSAVRNRRIYCDGHTIKITTNLCDALQKLRSPTDVRAIWADSVCINQGDVEEKGQQVAIMGQIYSRALRVLIYLGQDPTGHGPKVNVLLSDVDDFLQSEMAKLEIIDWDVFPRLEEYANHPLLTDEHWHSVRTLLEHQWFERGWVVREAGLARQAVILWGDSEISWPRLMWTTTWSLGRLFALPGCPEGHLYRRLSVHTDCYIDQHISTLRVFFSQARYAPNTLLTYSARGRAFHFTERRDNIYAFLDLAAKPTEGFHILPNYAKPILESFKDFAIDYLAATGDQTMLSYVVHDTRSLQSALPSWVPRWDFLERRDDPGFWFIFTSRSQQAVDSACPVVLDGKILKIRHAPLGAISFASETLYESTTTPELTSQLWQGVQVALRISNTHVSQRLNEFVRIFTWGPLDEGGYLEKNYVRGLLKFFITKDSDEEVSLSSFNEVQTWIAIVSNARRFIVTESGHFGLGPAMAQNGDVVARLYGSKSLPKDCVFLLRPTNTPLYYKFISSALIHYSRRTRDNQDTEQGNNTECDYAQKGDEALEKQDIYLC
jgi:hypothetical protein